MRRKRKEQPLNKKDIKKWYAVKLRRLGLWEEGRKKCTRKEKDAKGKTALVEGGEFRRGRACSQWAGGTRCGDASSHRRRGTLLEPGDIRHPHRRSRTRHCCSRWDYWDRWSWSRNPCSRLSRKAKTASNLWKTLRKRT